MVVHSLFYPAVSSVSPPDVISCLSNSSDFLFTILPDFSINPVFYNVLCVVKPNYKFNANCVYALEN
jgi:hypothetical protein